MDAYAFVTIALILFIANLGIGSVIDALRLQIQQGNGNEVFRSLYDSLKIIRVTIAIAAIISLGMLIYTVT